MSQYDIDLEKVFHDDGICIIDNLPDKSEFTYFSDIFCNGFTINKTHKPLSRVKLLGSSCINASHASSAMDIVLGAFRYCVNQPENEQVAKELMSRLVRMTTLSGLLLRPIGIREIIYRVEYDSLVDRLNTYLPVHIEDF